MRTLEQQIYEIAVKELGIPACRFSRWARFRDLGADSFDIVNLLIALEEKFKIELPFERVDELDSLGSITACMGALPKPTDIRI